MLREDSKMTDKVEQAQQIANTMKAINVATQSLKFACETLLELQQEITKPEIVVNNENVAEGLAKAVSEDKDE
jgi:hypothetical protein